MKRTSWWGKLVEKLVTTKPRPFRLPNRYEVAIVTVLGCIMILVVPTAQNSQKEIAASQSDTKTTIDVVELKNYQSSPLPTAGIGTVLLPDEIYAQSQQEENGKTDNTEDASVNHTSVTDITDTDSNEFSEISMFTTSYVNLRKNPSKSSEVITKVPESTILTITNQHGNWSYTTYKDHSGWICNEYLYAYAEDDYIKELGDLGINQQRLVKECIDEFGFDVDENFFYGLMYVETRFSSNCTSYAEAQGIMQITPSTWRMVYSNFTKDYPELCDKYSNGDPYDLNTNIVVGMYIVKVLMDEAQVTSLSDNASRILTSYNRGGGNAISYYRNHGTYSTEYSQNVLRAAEFIRINKYWKEGI